MHNFTLRPHQRRDMMSRSTHVTYDKKAHCQRWDSFLERVMPAPEARAYLQRAGRVFSHRVHTRAMPVFLLGGWLEWQVRIPRGDPGHDGGLRSFGLYRDLHAAPAGGYPE